MLSSWRKLTEEILFSNPWWKYMKDTFITGGGTPGEYHYVHTPGSVMIVPRFDDGSVQLVKQYRYLQDKVSIEFPGGGVKEGMEPRAVAEAELREEAGLKASSLEEIGRFNPYNGVTDELCHVFLATGLSLSYAAPDETEEFELVRLQESEFQRMIAEGRVWDGMTLASWQIYRAGKLQ